MFNHLCRSCKHEWKSNLMAEPCPKCKGWEINIKADEKTAAKIKDGVRKRKQKEKRAEKVKEKKKGRKKISRKISKKSSKKA